MGLEFSGLILLIAVLFSLNREWEGPAGVFAVSAAMILAGQAVRRFLFYGLLSNRAAEAGSPFTGILPTGHTLRNPRGC